MEKLYIVITGKRNSGKSSLINALLGQNKAIVSEIPGTTTDPVKKSYEIPGYASVVFIDTAGIDDTGTLGAQRINKTFDAIRQADAAIVVFSHNCWGEEEEKLVQKFQANNQPFLIVHNKSDLSPLSLVCRQQLIRKYNVPVIDFSAQQPDCQALLAAIQTLLPAPKSHSLTEDLVQAGSFVLLVTPIDTEAPTGRMILPQVQMLRDLLDNRCLVMVAQPEEIPLYFECFSQTPDLVITDSQAFGKVVQLLPSPHIPLTSFSIILAHHKGNFENYLAGIRQIGLLKDGDRILMLESCSHHVSCEDIGRVKIPALLRKYTGKQLTFEFVAGLDQIQGNPREFALIIQCGGCMITATQLRHRLRPFIDAGIPVCNYGMVLAYIQGILERAIAPFQKGKV